MILTTAELIKLYAYMDKKYPRTGYASADNLRAIIASLPKWETKRLQIDSEGDDHGTVND